MTDFWPSWTNFCQELEHLSWPNHLTNARKQRIYSAALRLRESAIPNRTPGEPAPRLGEGAEPPAPR